MRKTIKIQEKKQKYAKKFAYIKNFLYLCVVIQKQPNNKTPAATEKQRQKKT